MLLLGKGPPRIVIYPQPAFYVVTVFLQQVSANHVASHDIAIVVSVL